MFDPLKATEIAAVHSLSGLLAAQRLNRLEIQHAADRSVPSAHDVAERLIDHADRVAQQGAIGRRIATMIAVSLVKAAHHGSLSPTLSLAIDNRLERWGRELSRKRSRDAAGDWRRGLGAMLSDREARESVAKDASALPSVPPGMPIG